MIHNRLWVLVLTLVIVTGALYLGQGKFPLSLTFLVIGMYWIVRSATTRKSSSC